MLTKDVQQEENVLSLIRAYREGCSGVPARHVSKVSWWYLNFSSPSSGTAAVAAPVRRTRGVRAREESGDISGVQQSLVDVDVIDITAHGGAQCHGGVGVPRGEADRLGLDQGAVEIERGGPGGGVVRTRQMEPFADRWFDAGQHTLGRRIDGVGAGEGEHQPVLRVVAQPEGSSDGCLFCSMTVKSPSLSLQRSQAAVVKLWPVWITGPPVWASGSSPGWVTSTVTCCQSDHSEVACSVTARRRQRTCHPSESSPAGTRMAAWLPEATPSTLRGPDLAAFVLDLDFGPQRPGLAGWGDDGRQVWGVRVVSTVAPSTTFDGVSPSAVAVGLGTADGEGLPPDHADWAVADTARARQRTCQPSVRVPAGTAMLPCVPAADVVDRHRTRSGLPGRARSGLRPAAVCGPGR